MFTFASPRDPRRVRLPYRHLLLRAIASHASALPLTRNCLVRAAYFDRDGFRTGFRSGWEGCDG